MQVEKLKTQPSFQPIELKITIESPEELRTLYGALNTSNADKIQNSMIFTAGTACSYKYVENLFETLYDIANEQGYIK